MSAHHRPIIKLKLTKLDVVLEVAGVVLLLVMWGFVLYYYPTLPEKIPKYFEDGKPYGFESKSIWLFATAMCTLCYIFILSVARFPHWAYYLVEVTEENAARLYRYCVCMVRIQGILLNVTVLWINVATYWNVVNKTNGLGDWFLPCILVMFLTPTIFYHARMVMTR